MATTTIGLGASVAPRHHSAPGRGRAVLRLLAIASTSLAMLMMSGCGAGRNAQTSHEVPAIPGVDADAGPIALRDLLIPFREGGYPAGSDVPLVVRMVSTAWQPVELSQVTPGAGGPMTVAPRDIALRQPTAAAAGSDTPVTSLVVPPQDELLLVPGSGPYLEAEHITAPLLYGASVPVRFTFSTGDSIDVDVPMAPPDYPLSGQPAPPAPASPAGPATQ